MPDSPLFWSDDTVIASPPAALEVVIARLRGVTTRYDNQVIKLRGECNISPDASTTDVVLRVRRRALGGVLVGQPVDLAPIQVGALGGPVVRSFQIAFDDVGLNAGKTIYVPTAGDLLLDAWVQVDEAWDSAPAYVDIGTAVGSGVGIFGLLAAAPLDASQPDLVMPGSGLLIGVCGPDALVKTALLSIPGEFETAVGLNPQPIGLAAGATSLGAFGRTFPGAFPNATPIKAWVSANGVAGGADPASTQGSATIYLVTATPRDSAGGGGASALDIDLDVQDAVTSAANAVYVLTAECIGAGGVSNVNFANLEARVD